MKYSEIVSITGVAGLKRIIGQRSNGLIVSDLDGNNKRFLSSRRYLFSPLESIAIYTINDSVPLLDILLKMKEEEPVDVKSDEKTLRGYMSSVLPDYDEDKVHLTDIKKLIKWFYILQEHDLIQVAEESNHESSSEENIAEE
ncbi:MAG: DUF5606 domain-containing protein [Chitinophagales bacterium]|nr:DUF5606 domain-containing protein [Chitinophagales bacterium]